MTNPQQLPEQMLYNDIQKVIGYALAEYGIGSMTVYGVVSHVKRELTLSRDDFIDECFQAADDDTAETCES
jgi:hypothetical protein